MLLVISCAQYLTKARSNFWPGIAPIHLYPLISRMFFWYSESFSSFPLPSLPFHNPFVCFSIGEWCFSFGVSFRWSWASVDLGFFTYRGPRLFTFKPSHKNRWKRFLAADRQTVHGCIKKTLHRQLCSIVWYLVFDLEFRNEIDCTGVELMMCSNNMHQLHNLMERVNSFIV